MLFFHINKVIHFIHFIRCSSVQKKCRIKWYEPSRLRPWKGGRGGFQNFMAGPLQIVWVSSIRKRNKRIILYLYFSYINYSSAFLNKIYLKNCCFRIFYNLHPCLCFYMDKNTLAVDVFSFVCPCIIEI